MLGMMIGMVIDMMQHEVPSSRNDWSYYKPEREDCQEKRGKPTKRLPLEGKLSPKVTDEVVRNSEFGMRNSELENEIQNEELRIQN